MHKGYSMTYAYFCEIKTIYNKTLKELAEKEWIYIY